MNLDRRALKLRGIVWGSPLLAAISFGVLLREPLLFVRMDPTVPKVDPKRLEGHVRALSETLVPRDSDHPENLDRVADYVARQFTAAGGRAERQGFVANKKIYQNVIARFGPDLGARIVLGGHYDSFEALPAADDNASGVAALLELADLLGKNPPLRTVELVAYTLEEPPYFSSDKMGSAIHAADLKRRGIAVDFMASVEMVGCFKDSAGSQETPNLLLKALVPSRGNFIAVVGRLFDVGLIRRIKAGMRHGSALPVVSLNAPSFVPGIDLSDHFNYWDNGFRAVMITDTAFMRNDNYHTAQDTAETLDYGRMALVVQDLYTLVRD